MICGPWTLNFGQIFSCHHFFSLCLEMTWFLVYECIMTSYRSRLHFVPVQWFLALGLKFSQIFEILDLIFGSRVYNDKLQINFEIHSGWMIFGQLTAVGLWNLAKYLVVATFFSSPDPKGHVRYCHHLASVVRPLTFSYFNLLLWNNWAKWNQTWQKASI